MQTTRRAFLGTAAASAIAFNAGAETVRSRSARDRRAGRPLSYTHSYAAAGVVGGEA